jgi:quinol-cytochrome oxidoreductase complex cytochrome b subunit
MSIVLFALLVCLALYAGWLNIRIYSQITDRKFIAFILYLWVIDAGKLTVAGRRIRKKYLVTLGLLLILFIAFFGIRET